MRTDDELTKLIGDHGAPSTGPRLAVVKIRAENVARSMPLRDAVFVKNRFRAHLGLAPN